MNTVTLQTIVKDAAKKANLETSFFSVMDHLKEGTYKVLYKDEGGRSTKCTDCPSKLVVYAYIDSGMTNAELQQELLKMFNKIHDHYGSK